LGSFFFLLIVDICFFNKITCHHQKMSLYISCRLFLSLDPPPPHPNIILWWKSVPVLSSCSLLCVM
jgi:hypothetical protein